MKEKFKKQKGITLVALVVTIVVLLILAGVSINLVVGNNGIINKSKEARDNTKIKAAEEQVALAVIGSYGEDGYDLDEINANLNKISGIQGTPITNLPAKVTVDGHEIVIEADGNVLGVPDRTGIEIGDYVNYTPTETSETVNGCTQENIKWQVLNINSDGSIDLIGEPTTSQLQLRGFEGYNTGVDVLNDTCGKLYSNSDKDITARSINMEDIDKHLTQAGENARDAYVYDSDTGKVDEEGNPIKKRVKYGQTATYYANRFYPSLHEKEEGIKLDAGVNKVDENEPDVDVVKDVTSTGIGRSNSATVSGPAKKQATKNLTVKQTYYRHAINATNYNAKVAKILPAGSNNGHWVASRSVHCNSGLAYFRMRYANGSGLGASDLCTSSGNEYGPSGALRPVVSLKSSIQVTPETIDVNGTQMHEIK